MRVMSPEPFTTIPVRRDTLRRLKAYKVGGKTYDDVLNELMEDQPSEDFIQEHLRRLREEERVPWEEVKARLDKD